MKIAQCENGHFYDGDKYKKCPFCDPSAEEVTGESQEDGTGTPRKAEDFFLRWKEAEHSYDENRTVGDEEAEKLMLHSFITGWLVCVEGPERGRDYRIRYGFNRIGRSHKMDICIFEDDGISRGVHCSIVYEDKGNQFLLVPGTGSFTWMGEALITQPVKLATGDRFRIGDTVLEFIAFCRDDVRWKMEKQ